jgi:mRNA interferase MazF
LVRLDPVEGHEQGGDRPFLVLSVDQFNHGPSEMLVGVSITSKIRRGLEAFRVRIDPPEAGLKTPSQVKTDQVRSISARRLKTKWGDVTPATLSEIEDRVRVLLGL